MLSHIVMLTFLLPLSLTREITIPDGTCFETYQNETTRLLNEIGPIQTEFDGQLRTIESVLGIPTPHKGFGSSPMAISPCSLIAPPSKYTVKAYDIANKLHFEKIKLFLNTNRILFRLLVIQQKVLEKYTEERRQTAQASPRPRRQKTTMPV
jgi:hypothetical protein